jgi:hypothetical protein
MTRSHTLLLVMAATALLAGCGGSGGGDETVTLRILADADKDGFVLNIGTFSATGNGPATGDIDSIMPGVGGRMFYSFPLAAIPPGATIQSATLEVTQEAVIGTPYATHGVLLLDHLDYGPALDGGDFFLVALTSAFAVISVSPDLGTKSADVTARVTADLAAARPNSQYRLRFSVVDTDNDGNADACLWTDAELSGGGPVGTEPRLLVTYLP